MATFLLETENLTKNYGATIAAENVSIKLSSGRVHALVGENGAGKSTIIKIITGLVRPSGGHIKWQGVVADVRSPASRAVVGNCCRSPGINARGYFDNRGKHMAGP